MLEKMPLGAAYFAFSTVLIACMSSQQLHHPEEKKAMNVKRITPVLFVKEIEPVLPFWLDKLGFTKTIEVPEGNKLAFVSLQSGTAEIMYQTYASAEHDLPSISAAVRKGPTFLYLEVENL